MPGIGDILASVVGGGLQGFVQGKQAKMQRETAQKERDRQFGLQQKTEQRQQDKADREMEKRNLEIAGKEEAGALLDTMRGISPNTPADVVLDLWNQGADAARRGGMDLKTYDNMIERSLLASGATVEKPLSALKQEQLTKAQQGNQVFTVTPEIAKEFGLPEGTKLSVDELRELRSTERLSRVRESQITENQANTAKIRKATNKQKEAKEIKERDLVGELRKIGLALGSVDKDSDAEKELLQLQSDLSLALRQKREKGKVERRESDIFYKATKEREASQKNAQTFAPIDAAQPQAQAPNQQNKRTEAEAYLKQAGLPITDNNINYYLNSVK